MWERSIHRKVCKLAAIVIVGLTSACASESTTRPDSAPVIPNPGAMWADGAKAVDTGEGMLTKGEKRLELGRQQIREGEVKVRDGNARAEKAKLEYEQAAAVETAAADTQKQARQLRAIGLRWETAIQDIKDGNTLIAKGKANIDRGESEIQEGRLLMETGSVLIRNAHRSRLGLSLLPLPKS